MNCQLTRTRQRVESCYSAPGFAGIGSATAKRRILPHALFNVPFLCGRARRALVLKPLVRLERTELHPSVPANGQQRAGLYREAQLRPVSRQQCGLEDEGQQLLAGLEPPESSVRTVQAKQGGDSTSRRLSFLHYDFYRTYFNGLFFSDNRFHWRQSARIIVYPVHCRRSY